MNELRALITIEAKLLFREPDLVARGDRTAHGRPADLRQPLRPTEPDPALGGLRFIDVFVPSLVVITVGTLGIQTLPIRLATYREKGVLRRLSTTPAHPLRLLVAQLVIYAVTAVIALVAARHRRPASRSPCRCPRDPLELCRRVRSSA